MATRANSTPAHAVALAELNDTVEFAEYRGQLIENISLFIANQMKEIHGGEWSVIVCHERRSVMIFQDDEPAIARPKRGGIV